MCEFTPHCRLGIRNKFAKLKIPFRKANMEQKAISFVSPSLWNSVPELIKKKIISTLLSIMLKSVA